MHQFRITNWFENNAEKVALLCVLLPVIQLYTVSFDYVIGLFLSYAILRLGVRQFALMGGAYMLAKLVIMMYGHAGLSELYVVAAMVFTTVVLKVTRSMTYAATATSMLGLLIVSWVHFFMPELLVFWEESLTAMAASLSAEGEIMRIDPNGLAPYMTAIYLFIIAGVAIISSYMVNILALRVANAPMSKAQCDIEPALFPMAVLFLCTAGVWLGLDGSIQMLVLALLPFVLSGSVYSWNFICETAPMPTVFKLVFLIAYVLFFNLAIMVTSFIGIIRSVFSCHEQIFNSNK